MSDRGPGHRPLPGRGLCMSTGTGDLLTCKYPKTSDLETSVAVEYRKACYVETILEVVCQIILPQVECII